MGAHPLHRQPVARVRRAWGPARLRGARRAGPPRRRALGLSFIELILALGVTGLVGAAVAMMLVSVSYGTTADSQTRAAAVQLKTVGGRIDAAARASKMVLARGDGDLVLWIADTRGTGDPNLSELRRIEHDPDTGRIISYLAPADLQDDTQYSLGTTEFNDATNQIKGSDRFPATVWANGVGSWQITLDHSDPHQARQIAYRLALAGAPVHHAVASVALRNHP